MPIAFISSMFSGCKIEKCHNNWDDFLQMIFNNLYNKDHDRSYVNETNKSFALTEIAF